MRRRLTTSLLVLALLVPVTGEGQSSASRTPTKSATASGGATKSSSTARSSTKASSKSSSAKQVTASKPRVAKPVVASAAKRPAPKAAPIRAAVPTDANALRDHLLSLVSSSTKSGRWGVMVVSITRGDTLFGHNADALLLPASTMKLYTSAVALERFGPAHQFRTEVLRDGAVLVDGTVQGNLILKGAGDPSLAPRFAAWSAGQRPMDALADQVVRAGITRVKGDIIGDASAFETQRVPDGWRTRYLQASYAARVSALSFNENLAHITVRPSTRGAVVAFGQAVSGLKLTSSVTVRPNTAGASVRVWQDTLTQQFRVSGWIGARSRTRTYQVVVEQPERFVAAAFRAALESRGIQVDGVVRDGAASSAAQRVTTWASPPLAQLVATMNGESNNHFAELLFRNAARTDSVVGSAATGNASLEKFLATRVGVARGAVHAADGSGLSTLDRVTPRSMVQLLGYGITAPWGQVLQQSLPIAGRTETLRGRMRGTAAQGNLRAKTGTTNEVTSLGGYVTARNGEELAFSFLYNGRELWRARAAIDAMGVTLASFSR